MAILHVVLYMQGIFFYRFPDDGQTLSRIRTPKTKCPYYFSFFQKNLCAINDTTLLLQLKKQTKKLKVSLSLDSIDPAMGNLYNVTHNQAARTLDFE